MALRDFEQEYQPPAFNPEVFVERLEGLQTSSASVLRQKAYEVLTDAGFDVAGLVSAARKAIHTRLAGRAQRSAKIAANLSKRLAEGKIELDKVDVARERLKRAPDNVKAHKEVLKRFERRLPPPAPPSAPTPERDRKLDRPATAELQDELREPLRAPRHRVQWAVDAVAHGLAKADYAAAWRFREAYIGQLNRPKTTGYDRTSGGVPGPRAPIRDDQLQAGLEFEAIARMLKQIRPMWTIACNFVLEISPPGREAPMTMVEFGKVYCGRLDGRRAAGSAEAGIMLTCAVLATFYQWHDAGRAAQVSVGRFGLRKSRLTETERHMLSNWNAK